jgi:HNH endonuclease
MTQQILFQNNKKLSQSITTTTLCKCGYCNELMDRFDRRNGRERFYKHGHNSNGSNGDLWKGGRCQNGSGYWMIWAPNHRRANNNRYVREHVIVFEATYNCCMLDWGVVHHRDRNRLNNIWYNLQGMTLSQHMHLHNKHNKLSEVFKMKISLANKGKIRNIGRKFSGN